MKLEQLRILITGAASGMGRHFSLRLAEAGARVAACDLDEEGLRSLEAAALDLPGSIQGFRGDVSEEASVAEVVRQSREALDGLNGLVNNAGIFRDGMLVKRDRGSGALHRMSLEQWQQVIDVDLTGPFLCTREFAASLIEAGGGPGVVINISSISRHGNAGQSNYSAAKAGLIADTVVWARELARHKIRVGAIAPGFIDTPILQGMRPEVLERMLSGVPLKRTGSPDEIFMGLRFIIECDYFTGRCIDIDGGLRL